MKNRAAKQQKYARLLKSTSVGARLHKELTKRICIGHGDHSERARTLLLDQAFFELNPDKFAQFTALLDVPHSANPGLARLMSVMAPWPSSTHKSSALNADSADV